MLKRLHRRQNGETPGISKIPRLKAAQSGVRYRYPVEKSLKLRACPLISSVSREKLDLGDPPIVIKAMRTAV